jgi:hypothetical protein
MCTSNLVGFVLVLKLELITIGDVFTTIPICHIKTRLAQLALVALHAPLRA